MKWLVIFSMLLCGNAFGQDGERIYQHKFYDITKVEDFQKIKRRRLTTDVDSTGFAMYAWGNECFFKVQLRNKDDNMNHYQSGTLNGAPYVEYGNNKNQYRMYVNKSGVFEFDAIIRERPDDGHYSFEFPIQTKGLTFWYQDTLSDIDKLDSFRPDSVVGSYAVYHSTRENTGTGRDGSIEGYGTGKAFHVYRVKVFDNDGNWRWGFMHIDTVAGLMKVWADPVWAALAPLPLRIDPTFGHTEVGATSSGPADGGRIWGLGPHEAASSGDADSASLWVEAGTGDQFTLGFYDDADGDFPTNLMADGDGGYTSVASAWNVQVFDAPVAITASTPYWPAATFANNDMTMKYDAVGGFRRERSGEVYVDGVMSDPFGGGTASTSRKYSIFVYYTAEAPTKTRRRGLLLRSD